MIPNLKFKHANHKQKAWLIIERRTEEPTNFLEEKKLPEQQLEQHRKKLS